MKVKGGVLCILACALFAKSPVSDPSPKQPIISQDITAQKALISALKANQKKVQENVETYLWREIASNRMMDGNGIVTKIESAEFEVTRVRGHLIRRKVSVNGEPLAREAQAKEDARIQTQVNTILEAKGKPESENQVSILSILECTRITSIKNGVFKEIPATVITFEPNDKIVAKNKFEEQAKNLEGAMYVSTTTHQIMNLEAKLAKSLKIGWGIVASVAVGSSFSFEQAPVNGDVWLPLITKSHLKGKMGLFKKFEMETSKQFINYKQATVDFAEITPIENH